MSVLLFHLHKPFLRHCPSWLSGFLLSGYAAVSFFFILSGFILTYVYSSPEKADPIDRNPVLFWKSRVARIYPAFALALLIAFPPFLYSFTTSHMISGADFSLGTLLVPLLLQSWWIPASGLWILPAWSLSVEAAFYFLFPLIRRRLFGVSLRTLALMCALGLLLSSLVRFWIRVRFAIEGTRWEYLPDYFPLFFAPTFLFGVLIGRMTLERVLLRVAKAPGILILTVTATLVLLADHQFLPNWARHDLILVPLFSLLILVTAAGSGLVVTILRNPGLVFLGESSYALYILHLPLLFWWKKFFGASGRLALETVSGASAFIIAVLLASSLVYLWVERPAHRWLVEKWVKRVSKTAG